MHKSQEVLQSWAKVCFIPSVKLYELFQNIYLFKQRYERMLYMSSSSTWALVRL